MCIYSDDDYAPSRSAVHSAGRVRTMLPFGIQVVVMFILLGSRGRSNMNDGRNVYDFAN